MQNSAYRVCTRCVMDTSDPQITFDDTGVCNHCHKFDRTMKQELEDAQSGKLEPALDAWIEQMKREGQGKPYDAIMGLSGGVDSSYIAWLVKQKGLRVLAVHCDSGWNSELAVANIESIVKKMGFHLDTHVIDWEEMRDLQLAFFKAGLANCDIPQDHAFMAVLYAAAKKHKIPYILSGSNLSTESILPWSWGYNALDLRHLRAVHRRFGKVKLKTFPVLPIWKRYILYPLFFKMRFVRVLNFVPYYKDRAKELIQRELGWRDYGGKHYESIFTKFFQSYYLPVKFGFDKRRAHYSSLVLSHQMTRDHAMHLLQALPYDPATIESDKAFVAKKMGISAAEFDSIIAAPPHTYHDYPSNEWLFNLKDAILRAIGRKKA